MDQYIKRNISVFALCLIASVGLSMNVLQGFQIPDSQITDFSRLAVWSALLLVLLFIGFYRKRTLLITFALFIIACVIGILLMRTPPGHSASLNQHYLFYCISCITVLIVFILSRTAIGSLFLFLLGVSAFMILSILKYDTYAAGYLLFLTGNSTLFFIRRYQSTARKSNAGYISSIIFPLISLLTCIGALALSFLVYECLIKPLNPPSQELALITELKSMQALKKTGIYSELHLYDDNLKTSNATDRERTIQKDVPQPEAKNNPPDSKAKEKEQIVQDFVDKSAIETNSRANAITYAKEQHLLLIIIISILAAIPFTITVKKFSRWLWYIRIRRENRQLQITCFYQYFLKKLRFIGCNKKPGDTLYEFAGQSSHLLREFSSPHADMKALTKVYTKVLYGNVSATQEEYDMFLHFYKQFFKNCRKKLGWFRYSLKFILI